MRRSIKAVLVCGVALLFLASPAAAGTISLAWDPVAGATGYHVYYGVQPGTYGPPSPPVATNSYTITGLQDCQTYYIAIKAYNAAGESPGYSNEVSGWSRPSVTSATDANGTASAMQGDQIVMDIMGANFQPGAVVKLNPDPGTCSIPTGTTQTWQCTTDADCVKPDNNPRTCLSLNTVVLTSVRRISCNQLQLLATVEPRPITGGFRPARVGTVDVTIVNPDRVFNVGPQGFEVLINPLRFDINKSDTVTANRIDGKDVVYLSRQFGWNESDLNSQYDADYDFNGDGNVDGDDLAQIASNLGGCWSASLKTWSLAACPPGLR